MDGHGKDLVKAIVALMFAGMVACGGARGGSPGGSTGCTPDVSEACTCAGGASGTRLCQSDGTFAACLCPGEDATVSLDMVSLDMVSLDMVSLDMVSLPDLPQGDPPAPDHGVTCSAPRLDCDGQAANGCETDTDTHPNHCGRCNNPCASDQRCIAGMCRSDGCPAGRTACAGACVDTQSHADHCGACGRRCNPGETCSAGRCNPPAGMCPSSCRTTADCAPCRAAGDPGNYCCLSNLCLYMTGACPAGDGGSMGGEDASGDTGTGGDGSVD